MTQRLLMGNELGLGELPWLPLWESVSTWQPLCLLLPSSGGLQIHGQFLPPMQEHRGSGMKTVGSGLWKEEVKEWGTVLQAGHLFSSDRILGQMN